MKMLGVGGQGEGIRKKDGTAIAIDILANLAG